jgi:hypothetical protein
MNTNEKSDKTSFRLLRIAGLLVVVFLLSHLLGLRSQTGILSGTRPEATWEIFLGLFYVLSWFSAILVAPILALANLFQAILTIAARRLPRRLSHKPLP